MDEFPHLCLLKLHIFWLYYSLNSLHTEKEWTFSCLTLSSSLYHKWSARWDFNGPRKVINTITKDYKYDSEIWHQKHDEKHSTNAKIAILLLNPSRRPNYENRTKHCQRLILSCLILYVRLYFEQTDSRTLYPHFRCQFSPRRPIFYDHPQYPRQALSAQLAMLQCSRTATTHKTTVDASHDASDDASSEEVGSVMHIHMRWSRQTGQSPWIPAEIFHETSPLPLSVYHFSYRSCSVGCTFLFESPATFHIHLEAMASQSR